MKEVHAKDLRTGDVIREVCHDTGLGEVLTQSSGTAISNVLIDGDYVLFNESVAGRPVRVKRLCEQRLRIERLISDRSHEIARRARLVVELFGSEDGAAENMIGIIYRELHKAGNDADADMWIDVAYDVRALVREARKNR